MVPTATYAREIRTFIFLACLVIFLLLVVVVPAQSQSPAPPNTNAVEVVDPHAQFAGAWVLTIASLILLLLTFMLSYLRSGLKREDMIHIRHPHWWTRVRFHH